MAKRVERGKSKRRQSPIASFMIFIAIVVVCIVAVHRGIELNAKSKELSRQEAVLEQKIKEAEQEKADLEAEKQYMLTNQYIEDVAKDKLGLVYPDEVVIRPN